MNKYRVGISLGLLLLFGIFGSSLAKAQVQNGRWSEPFRLSNVDGVAGEGYPVTDQYGFVHVFWTEASLADNIATIQYARYDGQSWTDPVDIYATAPGGQLDRLSPAIDRQNNLHLIWTEGGSHRRRPIFYAQAPAHEAMSAQNWSSPIRIDVQAHLVRLQVDSEDNLHILYSEFFEPRPGIYYLRSEDKGETWSSPTWIDQDIPPNNGPAELQFALDEADGLHAVWFYMPQTAIGADWVRYTRSVDGGKTWSTPFTIDREDGQTIRIQAPSPLLTVMGETVHVIWAAGNLNYRNHRMSKNRGQTWEAPTRIFGELNGQAFDGLASDASGRIHFAGQIRYPQGIYHAYWDQDRWSTPTLVYLVSRSPSEPIGNRVHAHHVRPVIRAGNQLIVLFTDPPTDPNRRLFAMHRLLTEVPSLPAMATPTSLPTSSSPTPTPLPLAATLAPTAPAPFDTSASPPNPSSTMNPFWLALMPIPIFLGGVVGIVVLKRRRHSAL